MAASIRHRSVDPYRQLVGLVHPVGAWRSRRAGPATVRPRGLELGGQRRGPGSGPRCRPCPAPPAGRRSSRSPPRSRRPAGHPTDPLEPGQGRRERLTVGGGHRPPAASWRRSSRRTCRDPAAQGVVAEQRAELVAAQHPPGARRSATAIAHRSASGSLATTRSASDRLGARASARSIAPGSSGLGKPTVGKSGSGSACSATTAAPGSRPPATAVDHDVAADPVHRGVDPVEAARARRRDQRGDPARGRPRPARRRARAVARRAGHRRSVVRDVLDPCGDLGVGRRHDLGAVAEVDLVAVVLRRVVRGRHHHAGHAAEVPDRRTPPPESAVGAAPAAPGTRRRPRSRRCRGRTRRTCAGRRGR